MKLVDDLNLFDDQDIVENEQIQSSLKKEFDKNGEQI